MENKEIKLTAQNFYAPLNHDSLDFINYLRIQTN